MFTDPETGAEHGYTDGWKSALRFDYTGEGQYGDQTLRDSNLQVLRHLDTGRTLRLFNGTGGVVEYVGEFRIDTVDPYEYADAPETNNGPIRATILFHLNPIDAAPATSAIEVVSVVQIDSVPIEEQNTERFIINPSAEPTKAERKEALLVRRFASFLEKRGHSVTRKRIRFPDRAQPLFTDLFIEDANLLVEAKGSLARESIRCAIGQLLDYRRYLDRPRCVILLPARPSADIIALAGTVDFGVCWEEDEGQFASTDPLLRTVEVVANDDTNEPLGMAV